MNMMRGFLGSYLEGFNPSRMPPWVAAREVAEVAAGFAVTVAVSTEVMTLAMMMTRHARTTFPHGPKSIEKRKGERRKGSKVERGRRGLVISAGESSGKGGNGGNGECDRAQVIQARR